MVEKIILIAVLIVGALISYLSRYIGSYIKILKSPEANALFIKGIGFLIVIISCIIAFMKF